MAGPCEVGEVGIAVVPGVAADGVATFGVSNGAWGAGAKILKLNGEDC